MYYLNRKYLLKLTGIALLLFAAIGVAPISAYASSYTLQEAITRAQAQDPWITGSIHRQDSIEALSQEAGSLPDPTVNIGIANLPVDTFDFSQEAMTQFKVGVSQMFPRGKTRSLKRERLENLGQMQPEARKDRKAKVAVIVAHLWLEAYRSQLTIQLIENDRGLFEHLVDVSQSNYTSTAGRARQQDIVRAQLELTRLEDRLTRLRLQRDMRIAQLGEWLNDPLITLSLLAEAQAIDATFSLPVNSGDSAATKNSTDQQVQLAQMLSEHPLIRSIDWKIRAFETDIDLAKQSYKPQWGLNASYGYREQSPLGEDRSDFFSVGVNFDVPLFTGNRQDKKLKSVRAEYEAIKTERALALRQLKSSYESAQARHHRLNERHSLFNTRLLNEMAEQAEASLAAYTNDNGDFAEVVRARIAELNARIEAIDVEVELQKNKAQLNYFWASHFPETSAPKDSAR